MSKYINERQHTRSTHLVPRLRALRCVGTNLLCWPCVGQEYVGGGAGGLPAPTREEGDTLSELIPPPISATLSLLALWLLLGVFGSNWRDNLLQWGKKNHHNYILDIKLGLGQKLELILTIITIILQFLSMLVIIKHKTTQNSFNWIITEVQKDKK